MVVPRPCRGDSACTMHHALGSCQTDGLAGCAGEAVYMRSWPPREHLLLQRTVEPECRLQTADCRPPQEAHCRLRTLDSQPGRE